MNKTIRTMLAFLMVISMVAPAMADGTGVTASAWGSAASGYYGSASTGAQVTYTGMLTSGDAGAGSSAYGQEVYSESSAGGYVIGWQEANVGAGSYASAESYYYGYSDVSAYGYTGASTLEWVPVEMSTDLNVNANADSYGYWYYYGGSVEVATEVGTIADMNLDDTPGIISTGFAGASSQDWYWYGDATVNGYSVASGSNGVEVGAGAETISPGVVFDVELYNWAYAGILEP